MMVAAAVFWQRRFAAVAVCVIHGLRTVVDDAMAKSWLS